MPIKSVRLDLSCLSSVCDATAARKTAINDIQECECLIHRQQKTCIHLRAMIIDYPTTYAALECRAFPVPRHNFFVPFFANPLTEMRLVSDCLVAFCSNSRFSMPLFEFDERALESQDSRSNLVKKCSGDGSRSRAAAAFKMIGSDSLEHMQH